jgi:hypothetical protein
MKTRPTILTLAVGTTLALVTPAAQAQIQKGGRSMPLAASSHTTAAAQKAMKARAQFLVDFYKVHGAGAVGPGGIGLISSSPVRPDDRAGTRGA